MDTSSPRLQIGIRLAQAFFRLWMSMDLLEIFLFLICIIRVKNGDTTFAYHPICLSLKFHRFLPIRQKPIGVKFNTFLAYQYFILSPFFPIRIYFCLSENTFLVKFLAINIFQYILLPIKLFSYMSHGFHKGSTQYGE